MTIEKPLHLAAIKKLETIGLPSFSDYVARLLNADIRRKQSAASSSPRRFNAKSS